MNLNQLIIIFVILQFALKVFTNVYCLTRLCKTLIVFAIVFKDL